MLHFELDLLKMMGWSNKDGNIILNFVLIILIGNFFFAGRMAFNKNNGYIQFIKDIVNTNSPNTFANCEELYNPLKEFFKRFHFNINNNINNNSRSIQPNAT